MRSELCQQEEAETAEIFVFDLLLCYLCILMC
jgi:hypothetical protein